ncbi:MAG TPA: hypothetical protein PKA98_00235 [Acidimicrobiales bacterium]|nr:hypothetical protein [Acidimicrobiales bacterium]
MGDTASRGDGPGEMGANLLTVDLGTGRTATALATREDHTCAVLDDGSVKCWGGNATGQLGLGDTASRGDNPGEMGDDLPTVDLGAGRTATSVTTGNDYTCALLDGGDVKCWGDNADGRLGLGDTARRGDGPGEMGDALPVVELGTGRTGTAITAGANHTCAVLDAQTVKCWGRNLFGELGLGDTANRGDGADMGDALPPVDFGAGRTATVMSAGFSHSCALLDDDTLKCWGFNGDGRLGLGDFNNRGDAPGEMGDALPAIDLGSGRTVASFSTGAGSICAILDDAELKCWGYNLDGRLGLGDTATRGDAPGEMGDNLPAVQLGAGRTAVEVYSGEHSCARLDDGTVRCWGPNGAGQLGLGDAATRGDGPGEMGDNLPAVQITASGVVGRVTSTDGTALVGSLVALLDPTDFSIAGGASTNGDGRFTAPAAPGTVLLYALPPTGDHVPGFFGSPTVVVAGSDDVTLLGPALTLVPTFGSVEGTVTEPGSGAPLPGTWAIALDGASGLPEAGALVDGASHYSLDLVPGTHTVVAIDPSGAHAPAVVAGVTVTAGAAATADLALAPQAPVGAGTVLSGRLTDEGTGAFLPGLGVVALRASDHAFVRATTTNATGNYALYLPHDNYVLLFFDGSGRHAPRWYGSNGGGVGTALAVTAPGIANDTLPATMGALSGTVRTPGGAPVANAWVAAIGPTGVAAIAGTAADGTYAVADLASGAYRAAVIEPASGTLEYVADSPGYLGASVFAVLPGNETVIDATLG